MRRWKPRQELKQCRDLETRTKAETMEETAYLLACSQPVFCFRYSPDPTA